ncbi:hypothetical protein GOHSU_37_00510 [Gordonia hirsuta DSM 44140 = NBRC 16056]|uniref:DUF4149 domain-containing protein n=1 Tax=Gordonia hirsuta DSM 44140 = NBRC 16056 TaxID=1121927 RepID=L7LB45_9ACTN|nr:hypothetical protein [Gordonia hirsuta]GAC58355.1 hypothetical protein GOHSU_37_00510 [Gordonia hirsuta DSM 44140 = NBRC 16056]
MSAALGASVALVFLWLGMVLAISFLEAPLKFTAPGITLPLGLGIGRLVFRALNAAESVLAATVVILAVLADDWPRAATWALLVAIAALACQLVGVRPALARRTDAVLADPANVPTQRSTAHLFYVALELVKVAGLLSAGILLL